MQLSWLQKKILFSILAIPAFIIGVFVFRNALLEALLDRKDTSRVTYKAHASLRTNKSICPFEITSEGQQLYFDCVDSSSYEKINIGDILRVEREPGFFATKRLTLIRSKIEIYSAEYLDFNCFIMAILGFLWMVPMLLVLLKKNDSRHNDKKRIISDRR